MSGLRTQRSGGRTGAVALLVALVALLATALLAGGGDVPSWEETAFRWGNAGGPPQAVLWTVMQLGNLLAVPAAALGAAAARRTRLAVHLLVAGLAAYLLARLLKELVGRGRPGDLLAEVQLRGADDAGQGFPSGHAAVAVALACVLLPHVAGRWRWAVGAAALLVCLARVHVGAHLPLDVVGGAALGVACASAVLLVAEHRSRRAGAVPAHRTP